MQLSVDAQLASLLSAQHWCQWTRMHAFLSCAFSSMCVWLITWLQVALLTHRTPVLPDLPCETAWLHANRVDDGRRAPEAVCRPPVLTGEPWVSPLPVPYLADERGELVGGWVQARELPHSLATRHTLSWQQQQAQVVHERDGHELGGGQEYQAQYRSHQAQEQAVGTERLQWVGSGAGSRGLQEQGNEGTRSQGDTAGAWWRGSKHRVMMALPYIWEAGCAQGAWLGW